MKRIALALLLSLVPRVASADEPDRVVQATPHPAPDNDVSVPLVGILNGAFAVQYERFVSRVRVGLATSLGFRTSGGHDYDTFEGTFGTEGRIYFVGKAPFSTFDQPAMVGPYVGLRADVGLTEVSRDGHVLGKSIAISPAALVGVRFAFFRRFELTPNVGIGFRSEFDPSGRLAPWTRPEFVRLGISAGVMF
ncbi:MAG TPA: hypothetical protein VIF62_26725 [Labilithrix sp.]